MVLFRSLVLGMLGACLLLLAHRPEYEVRWVPAPPVVRAPVAPSAEIVDVAPGIGGVQLDSLIRLAPGEQVVAVADYPVSGTLEAGAVLASLESRRSRSFIDLTVAGGAAQRRVLLLLH